MSEVGRVVRACVFAMPLISGAASAQGIGSGAPLRDPAIERANAARLASLAADALRRRAAADSIRKFVQFPDTIREGRIRIATKPEFATFARGIARDAEEALAKTFGTAVGAAPMTFVLRSVEGDAGTTQGRLERWISDTLEGAIRLPIEPGPNGPIFLVDGFARKQFAELDSTMRTWLRYPLQPAHDRKLERSAIYTEIATSDNRIARDCRAGSLERCRQGFAFEQPADPVMSWYEPANRRLVARRFLAPRRRDRANDRCLQGDDLACIAELRSWAPKELPPPLSSYARHSLTWVALELGGEGSLARLASSKAETVDQRLAEAARTTPETLIAAWRDSVIAARPRPIAASPGTAWAAVMWGTFLGILSMRSSRWRTR